MTTATSRLPRSRRRLGHALHPPRVGAAADQGPEGGQGEQIGRVGNSGTEEYHLHYTQLADGKAVRIAFNGSLINTHAGQSSCSTWGNGEKLTSLNCPMNSFLHFDQTDGKRYQLAYKPGTGGVDIDRINAAGKGVTGVWSRRGTRAGPTSPRSRIDGKPHYFAYKSSTGEVDFDRVNPGGLGMTTIGEGTWSKGWTNFMPFTLGGKPYYVAYNHAQRRREPRSDQRRRQRRVDAVVGQLGQGLDAPRAVRPGRDAVLRRLPGRHRRGRDRQDHRRRQQRHDHRGVGGQLGQGLVAPGADDPRRRGADAALQVDHRACLARSGQRRRTRHPDPEQHVWGKSWTTFTPFSIDGKGYYLDYRTGTGQVAVDKLHGAGTRSSGSGRAGGASAGRSRLGPRPQLAAGA